MNILEQLQGGSLKRGIWQQPNIPERGDGVDIHLQPELHPGTAIHYVGTVSHRRFEGRDLVVVLFSTGRTFVNSPATGGA